MNYFIFDYSNHLHLINSFLESSALAHGHKKPKDIGWFMWKFRDNPFGKTILACVEEKGQIIGCVAYGIQPFLLKGVKIKGALAFENFVHPSYQGRGIFKKLIAMCEVECRSQNINVLFVFPNRNSLPGYKKMEWKILSNTEYWIKIESIFRVLLNFKNLKTHFIPNKSNLNSLSVPLNFVQKNESQLTSLITVDYLNWRFFTFPVSEYLIIDSKNYYSIIRMGKRGEIKEAQVLLLNIKNKENFKMTQFLNECKTKGIYDILSFSVSKGNTLINKYLKKSFFVKVPNNTNISFIMSS